MNFPEQTFLFSVGQLGLWWVAPSHTGGRGAACPASRAGSSCSVPTAPSSRGHARWLYRAGLHLPPRPVFIHALPFCCSKHGQKAPRRLGQCPCPSGDSLQDHATRDHSPGTAPAAQCTAACAGPEGSGSMQQCRNLSSSSRYMPSCPKTSNQPAAGLKGRSVVGDQGHPPTVSTGPFSLPPSLASRQVSADSGCCSDSVVPSL